MLDTLHTTAALALTLGISLIGAAPLVYLQLAARRRAAK